MFCDRWLGSRRQARAATTSDGAAVALGEHAVLDDFRGLGRVAF